MWARLDLPWDHRGKYSTTSQEAAQNYANKASAAFPQDGTYSIVKTEVPNSTIADIELLSVDGGIPAFVLPESALPGLAPDFIEGEGFEP